MKKSNQLIMGIGHRIKSLANPDQRVRSSGPSSPSCAPLSRMQVGIRYQTFLHGFGPCKVEIIKGFAKKNFKSTPVLDYALAVELWRSIEVSSAICN